MYLGGVVRGAHTYFLRGDYLHYFVSCHVLGNFGREWVGNRHVLFPACTEGKKDEEAKVTECITVLLLVWRISTKTSFWFKSVGCVGALA